MKFTFTHLTGSKAGQAQELPGPVITVGRDPSNTVAFDPVVDDKVSGFHANFTVQGEQVLLTDLGSSNGTYFNGQKISMPIPIVSGANIQFGENGPIVCIMFQAGAVAAAPAAAGAPGAPAGVAPTAALPAVAPPPTPAGAPPAPAGAPPAAPGAPPAAAAPAPAAPAPAAAAPAAAAPAPAAPPPAAPAAGGGGDAPKGKTFTKGRCAILAGVLGLVLVCVLGLVAWKLSDFLRRRFPATTQLLMKIPVVGKVFQAGAKAKGGVNKVKGAGNKVKNKGNRAGRVGKELGIDPSKKEEEKTEEKTVEEKTAEEKTEQ